MVLCDRRSNRYGRFLNRAGFFAGRIGLRGRANYGACKLAVWRGGKIWSAREGEQTKNEERDREKKAVAEVMCRGGNHLQ
jgi:hypothetical protein